jgi:hypothetical protein
MPDQEEIDVEDQPSAEEETEQPSGKPPILMVALKAAALLVLIGAECLMAYLYLPSAADTEAMANATFAGQAESDELMGGEDEAKELVNQVEMDLGEFSVTSFQPVSNSTLRIDFHLFGTVETEHSDEFLTLMDDNMHRFREQVIVTVRGADITDLTDAGLGLVKRKILEKTNRIIGKPLLRTVIFSEFSFIEQ